MKQYLYVAIAFWGLFRLISWFNSEQRSDVDLLLSMVLMTMGILSVLEASDTPHALKGRRLLVSN